MAMKTKKLIHQEPVIDWGDFKKVEIRIGTVLSAEIFKEAKRPAYKFKIDFGDFGQRKSSAQVTALYRPEELIGKQVTCVVNFPSKQIANMQSECLILGAVNHSEVTVLSPDKPVPNGLRVG